MARGGSSPYRKGAAHERAVADHLRGLGALVVRSPQSGQEMDLTALWPKYESTLLGAEIELLHEPWLVQCKTTGYMRPAEREALIGLASKYGALPVVVGGKPFTFTDLSTGGQIEPPSSDDGLEAAHDEIHDRQFQREPRRPVAQSDGGGDDARGAGEDSS